MAGLLVTAYSRLGGIGLPLSGLAEDPAFQVLEGGILGFVDFWVVSVREFDHAAEAEEGVEGVVLTIGEALLDGPGQV